MGELSATDCEEEESIVSLLLHIIVLVLLKLRRRDCSHNFFSLMLMDREFLLLKALKKRALLDFLVRAQTDLLFVKRHIK